MRKTLWAGILILIGAMAHSALQPMSTLAQARGAAVQTKPISSADAAAIAPLLKQAMDLNEQIITLRRQLAGNDGHSGVLGELHLAEQKAFVNAGLDMAAWQISRDGKSFEPRQQGIPQQQH